MKRLLPLITILVFAVNSYCQQIPPLSQYAYNHYLINPAAAGVTDSLALTFTFRKMWTGIEGSPSLQYLSGNMKVAPTMGAGVNLFNYILGPLRKTGLELTYSYHINLNSSNKLAFGLSAFIYQFNLDKSKLTFEEQDDLILAGSDQNMFVPDVSFGTYFYGPSYHVGLSVPQLFNRNIDLKTDDVLQEKQVRHYYLSGGYDFRLNPELMLKPSVLIKLIEAGLYQVDVNARFEYKEAFIMGVSFRTSDAVVFQLGFHREGLLVGYSYDLTISHLNAQSFGSHEIFVRYLLGNPLIK